MEELSDAIAQALTRPGPVVAAIQASVQGAVGSAINAAVGPAVDAAVKATVGPAVNAAVQATVGPAVSAAVQATVGPAVNAAVQATVGPAINAAVGPAVSAVILPLQTEVARIGRVLDCVQAEVVNNSSRIANKNIFVSKTNTRYLIPIAKVYMRMDLLVVSFETSIIFSQYEELVKVCQAIRFMA